MWLCAGTDVTRNSCIQQTDPPWPSGQGGENPSDTVFDGWSGDGTAHAMVRIEVGTSGEPIIDMDRKDRGYGREETGDTEAMSV